MLYAFLSGYFAFVAVFAFQVPVVPLAGAMSVGFAVAFALVALRQRNR